MLPVNPSDPVICALPVKIPSHEPESIGKFVKPEPSPTKEPVNEEPVKSCPIISPLALILLSTSNPVPLINFKSVPVNLAFITLLPFCLVANSIKPSSVVSVLSDIFLWF